MPPNTVAAVEFTTSRLDPSTVERNVTPLPPAPTVIVSDDVPPSVTGPASEMPASTVVRFALSEIAIGELISI